MSVPLTVHPTFSLGSPRSGAFVVVCLMHLLLVVALMRLPGVRQALQPAALMAVLLPETPQSEVQPVAPEPTLQRLPPKLDVPLIVEVETPTAEPSPLAIQAMSAPSTAISPPSERPPSAAMPPVVSHVEYLRPPAPRYPPLARELRHQGIVELRVLVDADGHARDVQIERSSGHATLDAAAVQSLRAAIFRPYQIDGVARQVVVIVPIEFSLRLRTATR
jgi:protein TonB